MIGFRMNILRHLDDIFLMKVLIFHQKSVSHGAFSERILSDLNLGCDLRFLKKRLLPPYLDTLVLDDEPSMAYRLKNLSICIVQLGLQVLYLQFDYLFLFLLLLRLSLTFFSPLFLFLLSYILEGLFFIELFLNRLQVLSSHTSLGLRHDSCPVFGGLLRR
jgi:hypothetical protein